MDNTIADIVSRALEFLSPEVHKKTYLPMYFGNPIWDNIPLVIDLVSKKDKKKWHPGFECEYISFYERRKRSINSEFEYMISKLEDYILDNE